MPAIADYVPSRVIIENVLPEIDGGRFPAKRSLGEKVAVAADIFCDGHEVLAAEVRYRHVCDDSWTTVRLASTINDRWEASFPVVRSGFYEFVVAAWIDRFATWRRDTIKKADAGQEITSELLEGAALIEEAASRAPPDRAAWFRDRIAALKRPSERAVRTSLIADSALLEVMHEHSDRKHGAVYPRALRVWVDRERARFGTWYELFPRSAADEASHGTLNDVAKRLTYVAEMGFDVLYLPPIHPIGKAFRKGPNNSLHAGPTDPGSPWAIGAEDGGHKSIHPALGTLDDLDRLVKQANDIGVEIALDIAFQCSPDHPYVREHPEWFRHRPDGTIKYAENPPKKYQDIYPLDFECDDWQALWNELLSVVRFWIEHGVRIFRVDNPHTKPFPFWEWLIQEVRKTHDDVIFLAEAFTRPKVMKYLAKAGFSQSYTYFTWRNLKSQLEQYFTELTQTEVRDYMRPNLFANTPDILPEYLQYGGPAAFQIRLVLAATLGATYGIYGPPFETFYAQAVVPGSEEYRNSEKYQVCQWNWNAPNVFREFIARINAIRRENPALQYDDRLRFFTSDNENVVFYGKTTEDMSNILLMVVNLDPHHTQSAWIELPPDEFGIRPDESYQVHDLITDARFFWRGGRNFVQLDPKTISSHILRVRRRVKTEHDFDYFL